MQNRGILAAGDESRIVQEVFLCLINEPRSVAFRIEPTKCTSRSFLKNLVPKTPIRFNSNLVPQSTYVLSPDPNYLPGEGVPVLEVTIAGCEPVTQTVMATRVIPAHYMAC